MDDPQVQSLVPGLPLRACWLGRIAYRPAWALQQRLVAERIAGRIPDTLLLLEHDAVLTLGRGADPAHVRAAPQELARRGIEVIGVERGGEVTYHGPGQLVAYPIVHLAQRGLLLRPFVRALESALIATCAALGVAAARRDGHPGCWCEAAGPRPRKIGALGLRIQRGVSFHGIALNVNPDLGDFELIDPCGMPGVPSTSIARERGRPDERPSSAAVQDAGGVFAALLAAGFGAALEWLTPAQVNVQGGDAPIPQRDASFAPPGSVVAGPDPAVPAQRLEPGIAAAAGRR